MIVNNVNPNKLHDELIVAGIVPLLVKNDLRDGETAADNTWIDFADGTDMEAVSAVINAHDANTPQPTIRIAELKKLLAETDYAVIKVAEGAATAEEYAGVIARRQIWRSEINSLESQC